MENNQTKKQSNPKEKNVEELLRENLELNKEIYKLTQKSNRYILFAQIFAIIKIVLIIGPIILAIIYLPSFLKDAFGAYGEIFGGNSGADSILNNPDLLNNYLGK